MTLVIDAVAANTTLAFHSTVIVTDATVSRNGKDSILVPIIYTTGFAVAVALVGFGVDVDVDVGVGVAKSVERSV